jgi:DNA-binding transcriptional regulator GbsR (MarR family)
LFLHPHPHSITEISQALNISKGLASISIKELLKYRVILPVRASDTKWLRYQANPNYWESIQMVLQNREKKMLQDIGESFARLRATAKGGTSDRTTMQRHIELERMIKTAQKLLNVLLHIRRWELLASLRWGRTSG